MLPISFLGVVFAADLISSLLSESPSVACRSRLLSSTGTSIKSKQSDSFAPLLLRQTDASVVKDDDPFKSPSFSNPFLLNRPRAITLCVPSPSEHGPDRSYFHLLNGKPVPFPSPGASNRYRSHSHYEQGQAKHVSSQSSATINESAQWKEQPVLPLSNDSDQVTAQLSSKSSHCSMDTHYNSSFESSMAVTDLSISMSNSISETFDTSNESMREEQSVWKPLEVSREDLDGFAEPFRVFENHTGASSTQSMASESTVSIITSMEHIGRRKSHTISELSLPLSMAIRVRTEQQDSQDVFGPKTVLQQVVSDEDVKGAQMSSIGLSDHANESSRNLCIPIDHTCQSASPNNKPRRLTVGGIAPYALRNSAKSALYQPYKPSPTLKSASLSTPGQDNKNKTAIGSDTITSDQSVMAFQELIDAIRNERPIKSNAIEEATPAEPQSIGAVLAYQRHSPTGHRLNEVGQECELCGSVALRLTILEPCGHLSCAVCCSSGLNQVTATPPRPHLCAACHTPVVGITLRKGPASPKSLAGNQICNMTPRGPRHRPQTPSPAEQKLLYHSLQSSSSPVKPFVKSASGFTAKASQRRQSGGKFRMDSVGKRFDFANESCETTSSDLLTEDQSFYQSQRAMQHQSSQVLANRHRVHSASFASSRDHYSSEAMNEGFEQGEVRTKTSQGTSIVRIDNIPWTVTYQDVIAWLPEPSEDVLPDAQVSSAAIHIPVDVFTGKTSNCCFVECKNKEEARRLVRRRNNHRLLGRPVSECMRFTSGSKTKV